MAFSIHQLAFILGEELTQKDLLPVFEGFIKDLDEVRIGVLKHLAHFLKMLPQQQRELFLPRLNEFLNLDNAHNWRFRLELSLQLTPVSDLFTPQQCWTHICPITFDLMTDKVVEIRRTCFFVVSISGGESRWGALGKMFERNAWVFSVGWRGCERSFFPLATSTLFHSFQISHLARKLMTETQDSLILPLSLKLIEKFAHADTWTRRQSYVYTVGQIVKDVSLPLPVISSLFLPKFLDLASDKVPNIRLVIAKIINSHLLPLGKSCSDST